MLTQFTYDLLDETFVPPFRESLFEVLDETFDKINTRLHQALHEVINTNISGVGFFEVNDSIQKRGLVLDTQVKSLETLKRKIKVDKFTDLCERDEKQIAEATYTILEYLNDLILPNTAPHKLNNTQAITTAALSELLYSINRETGMRYGRLVRAIKEDKLTQ